MYKTVIKSTDEFKNIGFKFLKKKIPNQIIIIIIMSLIDIDI